MIEAAVLAITKRGGDKSMVIITIRESANLKKGW